MHTYVIFNKGIDKVLVVEAPVEKVCHMWRKCACACGCVCLFVLSCMSCAGARVSMRACVRACVYGKAALRWTRQVD